MWPENNERKFDEILKKNLRQYNEPIRQDFVVELSAKIKKLEQQKILAGVIRQEKILLATFIFLPLAAIIVMFAFPNLTIESSRLLEKLYPLLNQVVANFIKQWQLWIYYIIAVAVCLYALYETLGAEN